MIKLFQLWFNVEYGKFFGEGFVNWSDLIKGEKDDNAKNLNVDWMLFFLLKALVTWLNKVIHWRKCIVLKPVGYPETEFIIGYRDKNHFCKISSSKRKVLNGPFAMRIGPDDCEFFIIGNKNVSLKFVEYKDRKKLTCDLY